MNIPETALRVMQLLKNEGARDVLIVGGFVRDSLLGIPSKDVDIEVYGMTPDHIEMVLRCHGISVDAVGKSFGVLKIDNMIDVSVPRRENKVGAGHRGFSVQYDPDMSVEMAASRRDFTINSMAMRADGEIIDPFNGERDLRLGWLVATSEAFSEDPLRAMRGMQFAARFRLSMDDYTIRMCQKMAFHKSELPKERLWEEWKKWALKGNAPSTGLRLMQQMHWLDVEIMNLVDCPQDSEWHPEGDVFVHTGFVVDAAAMIADREQLGEHDRLVLMFSALTHDFGKPGTTALLDGRWRSKGHCQAGVELAERFLTRIGAPLAILAEVKPLISEHLVHAGIKSPSPRAIRRLANRIAPASVEALGRVIEADHSGRPPLPKGSPFTEWINKAHALDVIRDKPRPILMGRHLEAMGVSPGPQMGVALRQAFEAQLDGVFHNLEDAQQWVKNHV